MDSFPTDHGINIVDICDLGIPSRGVLTLYVNISLCVAGHMYLGADFKLFRIFVENFEETNSVLFHKCKNIIIIIIIIAIIIVIIIIIIIIIIDTRRVQTGQSTSCPSQEKRVISSALLSDSTCHPWDCWRNKGEAKDLLFIPQIQIYPG